MGAAKGKSLVCKSTTTCATVWKVWMRLNHSQSWISLAETYVYVCTVCDCRNVGNNGWMQHNMSQQSSAGASPRSGDHDGCFWWNNPHDSRIQNSSLQAYTEPLLVSVPPFPATLQLLWWPTTQVMLECLPRALDPEWPLLISSCGCWDKTDYDSVFQKKPHHATCYLISAAKSQKNLIKYCRKQSLSKTVGVSTLCIITNKVHDSVEKQLHPPSLQIPVLTERCGLKPEDLSKHTSACTQSLKCCCKCVLTLL